MIIWNGWWNDNCLHKFDSIGDMIQWTTLEDNCAY